MLINVKVKTLDALTHELSIDNEITVREFKDKVAEKTNISAEQQRIIYCGRVLVDEKQMKEYDVDGKVVHVAERPPFAQRSTSVNSTPTRNDRPGSRFTRNLRQSPIFRALDGMVVGTMAIPMNNGVMNHGQGTVNPFTLSSSFCMNRITVARHMLNCANNIAAYLEDPERGLNNTALDILARGRWTMESAVVEVGISGSDLPQTQNIVEMVQGAVSAALRRNGNTNVTVVQLPTVFGSNESGETADGAQALSDTMESTTSTATNASDVGGAPAVILEDIIEIETTDASSSAAQAGSIASNSTTSTDTATQPAAAEAANNSTSSTGTNTDDNNSRRRTGTPILAEVIELMRNVQTRLNPFIEQFYELLQNEPTFEENDTTGRANAQRLYDRVSEALHYLSHAQHAISDLMLDISQPAPRFLTCRPILVEQSGYVSSNNYISAAAAAAAAQAAQVVHMRQHPQQQGVPLAVVNANSRPNAPNATNAAASTERPSTAAAASTASSAASAATVSDDTFEDPVDDPPVVVASAAPSVQQNAANAVNQINDQHQMQMARLIQAVVNSAPIDTELHVQINAMPNILSVNVPINVAPNNNNGAQQQQPTAAGTAAAATGNGNANETTESSSPSTPRATADQAHVTTATLPTTATQTRSTSRPQLQMGNMPPAGWNGHLIPANMSSFDRFLPCNSHHIREQNNGNNGGTRAAAAATASTASTTSTGSQNQNRANTRPRILRQLRLRSTGIPTNIAATGVNLANLRNLITNMAPNLVNRSTDPVSEERIQSRPTLRSQLVNFATNIIFEGEPINRDTLPSAINRVVDWFGESLLYLPQYEKPEYNSRDSISNILREMLPRVFGLLTDDGRDWNITVFERELKLIFEEFMKRLYSVLCVCTGRDNADIYWGELMRLLLVSVRATFHDEALRFLLIYVNPDVPSAADTADAQQFIVLRGASLPEMADPMETDCDDITEEIPSTSDTMSCTQTTTSPPIKREPTPPLIDPLPPVVVGSQPWHDDFPHDWLPIITRDMQQMQSQTTQNCPEPFSDAYISGMSAKRRKVIQSSKPPPDAKSLIADNIRKAMQSVGVSTSTAANQSHTPEEVANAIASDAAVQGSYTEAVRGNVRERLKKDPNYKPDKYPQTEKFINK